MVMYYVPNASLAARRKHGELLSEHRDTQYNLESTQKAPFHVVQTAASGEGNGG